MGTIEQAERGHFVKIYYTVKLADGKMIGASPKGKPLGFIIGKGKVLKGIEQGVIGMCPGQTRTIELSPEQGYGEHNPDLVIRMDKGELPSPNDIRLGRTVQYMNESGGMVFFMIVAVDEQTVTLDANHPYAGQQLVYEVTLVSIEDPL